MSLAGALSIATGGLANVNRQMALVSQNVANANTPGYATEIGTQQGVTADGQALGVRTGLTVRNVDAELQAELFGQNATVAGLQTRQSALQAIDAAQGTPGQGSDIASLLGQLRDQFSTLLNSPDSAPQQGQVVSTAATLAQGINALSDAYTAQRQTAQDNLLSEVTTLNTTLNTIGGLSTRIVTLKASGQSIADLENQRDAALADLSQLVDVKALEQPSGDLLVATTAGLVLPIHATSPFATTDVNVQPGAYYPGGGIGGITLDGTDVTGQFSGGQIGANLALRDTTLPTDQAELDEFAQNLASRFHAQGLDLFTDPNGNVPLGGGVPVQNGYVGFAATIQVNPAVQANPSLVRDGTPNQNSSNLAGYTGIITAVLNNALGSNPPLNSNAAGLGPAGNLNAPYAGPTPPFASPSTLQQLATAMLAAQSQDSATTSTQADTEQAVQTSLASKLSAQSGVNMDAEMSYMIQLQNAYGANAKIISAVQAMWTQLLQSVA